VGLALYFATRSVGAGRRARTAASNPATLRGRRLLQAGQPQQAIQVVESIRPGDPAEPEAWLIRGLARASLQDVGPARQALEHAWRLRPDPMAAKVLAAIYLGAYETERGRQMLEAAAELDPNDFRPWYALGEVVHTRMARYDDAARCFREALHRRPDHYESRVGLVKALLLGHKPDEASPLLEALRKERPDDPAVLMLIALSDRESGRAGQASEALDRLVTLDPDNREALVLRARLRRAAGRSAEALADAARAVELDPSDLAALDLLASAQAAVGQSEQARATIARRQQTVERRARIDELNQQIELHPNNAELRWRLGQAAAEAGMKPLAIQSYQAALSLDPDCQQAREGLRAVDSGGAPSP
jgi:cytochrome c-type biogenesis protein CcmH/NrfG